MEEMAKVCCTARQRSAGIWPATPASSRQGGTPVRLLVVCLLVLIACFAWAEDDEFPKVKIGGVLDARFARTDVPESWLESGTGKLRYGGLHGEESGLVRLAQASLLVRAALSDTLSARLQLNIDAEPDRLHYRNPVDVIEAFISYRPVLSPRVRLRTRAGIFFPPVSLENTGPAWTTPYTITTSAINSWIGEEVRLTGGEFGIVFAPEGHEIGFGGAVFGSNDPAGSLLAWRGWALHDRQTGFSERLPLAPIPSIQPDGLFPRQAPYVQPFREIDGRLGYFGSMDWTHRRFEVRAQHYDNRGRQTEFDGSQYAWDTRFNSAGAVLHLPGDVDFVSQFLDGESRMGPGSQVYVHFHSAFGLLTASFGRHRLSARYEAFRVDDEDGYVESDNNNEDGSAWTAAYVLRTGETHRVAVELLRVESDRDVRESLGQPAHLIELIFQASFRLTF